MYTYVYAYVDMLVYIYTHIVIYIVAVLPSFGAVAGTALRPSTSTRSTVLGQVLRRASSHFPVPRRTQVGVAREPNMA